MSNISFVSSLSSVENWPEAQAGFKSYILSLAGLNLTGSRVVSYLALQKWIRRRRRRRWGRVADLSLQKELMFSHSGRWLDEQKSDGQPIVIIPLSPSQNTCRAAANNTIKMKYTKDFKPVFMRPLCSRKVCSFWLTPARFSEHAVIIAGCHRGRKKKGKEAATSVLKWMTHVTGVLFGSVGERRMTNHACASGGALTAYVRAGALVTTFGHFISAANRAAPRYTGLHFAWIIERQQEAESYAILLPTHRQRHSKKSLSPPQTLVNSFNVSFCTVNNFILTVYTPPPHPPTAGSRTSVTLIRSKWW